MSRVVEVWLWQVTITTGNHVFVQCWATYIHTYIRTNHRLGWNIGFKSMEPKSHPSHDFENVVVYRAGRPLGIWWSTSPLSKQPIRGHFFVASYSYLQVKIYVILSWQVHNDHNQDHCIPIALKSFTRRLWMCALYVSFLSLPSRKLCSRLFSPTILQPDSGNGIQRRRRSAKTNSALRRLRSVKMLRNLIGSPF